VLASPVAMNQEKSEVRCHRIACECDVNGDMAALPVVDILARHFSHTAGNRITSAALSFCKQKARRDML